MFLLMLMPAYVTAVFSCTFAYACAYVLVKTSLNSPRLKPDFSYKAQRPTAAFTRQFYDIPSKQLLPVSKLTKSLFQFMMTDV